jgi:hypothetical protein
VQNQYEDCPAFAYHQRMGGQRAPPPHWQFHSAQRTGSRPHLGVVRGRHCSVFWNRGLFRAELGRILVAPLLRKRWAHLLRAGKKLLLTDARQPSGQAPDTRDHRPRLQGDSWNSLLTTGPGRPGAAIPGYLSRSEQSKPPRYRRRNGSEHVGKPVWLRWLKHLPSGWRSFANLRISKATGSQRVIPDRPGSNDCSDGPG